MDKELREAIEDSLKKRKEMIGKNDVNEGDFLCGAMKMYLLLNPDSEADGSWCPPSWILGIMRGDKITEHV
tara:strand:- start:261 stop:473 length:213 start_codon:yes stop_codon:yes gene_type:complete